MSGKLAEISIVVGFLLPHLIALVNQQKWRSGFKSVVAFAACLIAALVTVWAQGTLDLKHWTETAAVIFGVAQASYHGLWKPTGAAPALEGSTSVS